MPSKERGGLVAIASRAVKDARRGMQDLPHPYFLELLNFAYSHGAAIGLDYKGSFVTANVKDLSIVSLLNRMRLEIHVYDEAYFAERAAMRLRESMRTDRAPELPFADVAA